MDVRAALAGWLLLSSCSSGAPPTNDTAPRSPDDASEAPSADTPGLPAGPDASAAAAGDTGTPAALDANAAPGDIAGEASHDARATAERDGARAPSGLDGLGKDVIERFAARTLGCIALSDDRKVLASYVPLDDGGPLLMIAQLPLAAGTRSETIRVPLGAGAEPFVDVSWRSALEGKALRTCREVLGAGPLRVPTALPITVDVHARRIRVALDTAGVPGAEPTAPFEIDRQVDGAMWQLMGVYYADGVGDVYVRLDNAAVGADAADPLAYGLVVVRAADLGDGACVPRPQGGKPALAPPPPFDPKPADASCLAMTSDGRKAAFKQFQVNHGDRPAGPPNRVVWVGPGDTPAIDLACMATKSCKPEQAEALVAAAGKLGLVGCGLAKGAFALDGALAPFMYKDDALRLKGGSGWRTIVRFDPDDDGTERALWRVFQHPGGGPLYLYVGLESVERQSVEVVVVDEAGLGLCEPMPRDALAFAELEASSTKRDSDGYKRGASSLVDGDRTTAWQPGPPKKGVSASLDVRFDAAREVTGLAVANGFQRVDGNGDLFVQHARVAELVVAYDDGTSARLALDDARGLRSYALAPKTTTRLTLTIAGMHAGTSAPDAPAISELRVLGR